MNLFQKRYIELHSGEVSDFKIECDSLTDEDLECLAYLVSKKIKFYNVIGIPTGGEKFAKWLEKRRDFSSDYILIADDVLTSGRSMENMKHELMKDYPKEYIKGVVLFARKPCPLWITPIFQMML